MDTIKLPDDKFVFDNLMLKSPVLLNGGNHFIKFLYDSEQLYIQPPKCTIKQSIVKTSRRMFCDLMFTNENDDFIRWIENLETYCQKYIYEHREKWFETSLDENDIENSFASCMKIFKSGKFYILRVSIPTHLGNSNIKIYDEYENMLKIEDIKEGDKVMAALEFQGIKCSPRSFQIEIELKQLLLLKPNDIFEKCVLKAKSNQNLNVKVSAIEEKIDLKEQQVDDKQVDDEQVQDKKVDEQEEQLDEEVVDDTNLIDNILDNEENIILEKLDNQNNLEKDENLEEVKNLEIEHLRKSEPVEVELSLDENIEPMELKKRNEIYYGMYREALRKAKEAKSLALAAHLEAKAIKNTYMLDDIEDSDLEDDSITSISEE